MSQQEGQTLLIRADASPTVGAGHVMRCLALAQEWHGRGGSVIFASETLSGLAQQRISSSGFAQVAVDHTGLATRRVAVETEASWIVIDVGVAVDRQLSALQDLRTLVIDDVGRDFTNAPTLLLNQNAHGPNTRYHGINADALLLGLDFVLLRDELLSKAPASRIAPSCSSVLVTLGGTDPLGLLPGLAESLSDSLDVMVHVASPSSHASMQQLRALERRSARVVLHIDSTDMGAIFQSVDIALTSGGTTVWELAYMGVPALVGTVSPLEDRLVEGLRDLRLFRVLGTFDSLTPSDLSRAIADACADFRWRTNTSKFARDAIDGMGRLRVADAMLSKAN